MQLRHWLWNATRTRTSSMSRSDNVRLAFSDDVNAWLVRHGYAWSMTFRGKRGPYARLQARARAERRGLWALPGAIDPRTFRKRFGRPPSAWRGA